MQGKSGYCSFVTRFIQIPICSPKAENEVATLTKELQRVEDELDAVESRLAATNEELVEAEKQADESERCVFIRAASDALHIVGFDRLASF